MLGILRFFCNFGAEFKHLHLSFIIDAYIKNDNGGNREGHLRS